MNRRAAAFIVPFVVFMAFLKVGALGVDLRVELILRLVAPALAIAYYWKAFPSLSVQRPITSCLVGLGVLVLWVAPELLWPGYRSHWLFQNALFGRLSAQPLANPIDLALRSLRAIVVVPIVEELFWRGWLMRWLIKDEFDTIPVGSYRTTSFLLTAVLFASVHGAYWEVGLLTGLIYNWWAVRTRSLGDLMLVHGVTNAALAAFVIVTHRWEFWM